MKDGKSCEGVGVEFGGDIENKKKDIGSLLRPCVNRLRSRSRYVYVFNRFKKWLEEKVFF